MSFKDDFRDEEEKNEEEGFKDEENEEENEEEEKSKEFEPSHRIMEKKRRREEEEEEKGIRITKPKTVHRREEEEKREESILDIGEKSTRVASKTMLDELPKVMSSEIKKISKEAVLDHIKTIHLLSKAKYYSKYSLEIVPICLDLFDEFNKRLVSLEDYRMKRDISAPIKSLYTMQQETMKNLEMFRRLYMDIVPFMANNIVEEIKKKLKEEGLYKNNEHVTSDTMDKVLEGITRIVLDVVGQEAANILKKSGIAESMANMIIQAGYQKLAESMGQNNIAHNESMGQNNIAHNMPNIPPQTQGAQSSQGSPQLDSPADIYRKLREKRNNNHGGESSPSS